MADTSNQGFVGQADLAQRPLLRPAEVLEAVPGLVITQHSGAGKANQYYLRGFQLDHGTDFAVTLEGVPQNLPSHGHGQGYLDLNHLIPELITSIDYRKGVYNGRVGDFSSAGSADIKYVDSLPKSILSLTGGNYGYARALAAHSFTLRGGNLLLAVETFHEDGPWNNPDAYLRINGLAKFSAGDADQGWSLEFLGMHGDWTATNQVAQRAIDSGLIDRFGTLDPSDGGNTGRYTLTAEGHQRDDAGFTSLRAYGAWYDMQLYNNFTYFLNDPVHGDQFEQKDRRFYGGLHASHTFYGSFLGRKSDTTVGLQLRVDDISNGLFNTQNQQFLSTVETARIVETSVGVYLENRTQWADFFRTEASLRGDLFNFHVRTNIPANSGNRNAAIFSPKVNFILGPWYQTELYLSAGYGFHSNDARGITTTISPGSLLPALNATPLVRAKGAEVGLRTAFIPGLQSTLSLWMLDLNSESTFEGDTAATVPGGPSRRFGVEFGNYWHINEYLTLDADYSISQARFTDHEPEGDYVPESIVDVLQVGITARDLFQVKGLFASLRLRYFGPRPLTQDNSVRSNSSTLLNAELGYQINDNLSIKLDVLNLLDNRTDDIQYFYTSRLNGEPSTGVDGRHVHSAEPFEFRITVDYRF